MLQTGNIVELSEKLIKRFNYVFLAILIISCTSFPIKAAAAENWYNNNWNYRKKITINHTKVPNTDQSNFPVLISLTDSELQAHARSDGYDILFTDSTGTTKIPYEREQYIASSGVLVAWVKVATLTHLTDTIIYMYYGNSEVASDQQDTTGETWDANFKGVWHSNDASPTTIADSTANANTGTKYGTAGPVEVTGKIGEAQSYDGNDNYINIVPPGTLSGSFTVSVWAKVADGESSHTVIGTRSGSDMSFDFKFDTDNIIHGDIGDGLSEWITTEANAADFSYATDTWYQITYVVTPNGYTIYVDGDEVASENYPESTPLFFDSDHNIFIGQVGYDDEWFNGTIDEVRISSTARSADWIQAEYNNENDPSTFYSLESEAIVDKTAPSTPGIPVATVPKGLVSTDLSSQDWNWTASTDTSSEVHYDWWVDDGPSGTTTTPTVTTNLPIGTWKFYVKAEDDSGNQSTENSSLLAIMAESMHTITVDCSVPLVHTVYSVNSISSPVVNLSPLVTQDGNLLVADIGCRLFMKTLIAPYYVIVEIPTGAQIKGPTSLWADRIIVPPILTTPLINLMPVPPSGFSNQVTLALKIGHNVAPLDITKGTRIFLEGQAGKKVGHISNNIFTEVTSICVDDSQATGDNLVAGKDCKIEDGLDLIIWTKHFSDFLTYDLVPSSQDSKFTKDKRCHWEKPPEITWVILEPKTIDGVSGLNLNWSQKNADKVSIRIDDGTGKFPWEIINTINDGHEFLPNVQEWQKIRIKPINHCKSGEYGTSVSLSDYPTGWFNL